jgi:hypothetical protein
VKCEHWKLGIQGKTVKSPVIQMPWRYSEDKQSYVPKAKLYLTTARILTAFVSLALWRNS